jgi:hypothetical protein
LVHSHSALYVVHRSESSLLGDSLSIKLGALLLVVMGMELGTLGVKLGDNSLCILNVGALLSIVQRR